MRLHWMFLTVGVAALAMGCDGGGGGGSGGSGAVTSSNTTTSTTSTTTSTSTSTSTTTSTSTSTTTSSSASGQGGSGATTSSTSSSGGAGGSGAGAPTGNCAMPCATPQDCCSGQAGCPTTFPYHFECDPVDGACENQGCVIDSDCAALGDPLLKCIAASNGNVCARLCATDNDCINQLFKCIGVANDGSKYCKYGTPECAVDADCDGLGLCKSQHCVCYADTDCTHATFTECNLP